MALCLFGLIILLPSQVALEGAKNPTPASRYQALIKDWNSAVKKAEAEGANRKGTWLCDETDRLRFSAGQRLVGLARDNPKDPVAVEALLWVTGEGLHRDTIGEALELLRRDHVADARISPACDRAFAGIYTTPASVDRFLRDVLAGSPYRDVRGRALLGLAVSLELRAGSIREMERDSSLRLHIERLLRKPENLAAWRSRTPCDMDREADKLLERVVAEFSDVVGADKRSLGDLARGELFQRRALAVGKVAPDIEGCDADGKRLRLSDYRGRVVVLTFSFNSCAPCRAMYPQERELVAKMRGKPFDLLSVSVDEDIGALKRSIAKGEITWRCWWDGGSSGPIATRWGISGFPSVFVFDKSGTIRFRDLRGRDLEKAAELLVNETETKP